MPPPHRVARVDARHAPGPHDRARLRQTRPRAPPPAAGLAGRSAADGRAGRDGHGRRVGDRARRRAGLRRPWARPCSRWRATSSARRMPSRRCRGDVRGVACDVSSVARVARAGGGRRAARRAGQQRGRDAGRALTLGRRRRAHVRHPRARAVRADPGAGAGAGGQRPGARHQRHLRRDVHPGAAPRRPHVRARRVQPEDLLRPLQARRGRDHRAARDAPRRHGHRRPLDAPRLGRHRRHPARDAGVPQGRRPDPAQRRGGRGHDRLARRRRRAAAVHGQAVDGPRVRPTHYRFGASPDGVEAREELWKLCERLANA